MDEENNMKDNPVAGDSDAQDMLRALAESSDTTIEGGAGDNKVKDSLSWRNVNMSDADSDSETDDEDDPDETKKFLSMMGIKPKKNLVNIRWVDGKVVVTPVTDGENTRDDLAVDDSLTVTRVDADYQRRQQLLPRHSLPDTVTINRVAASPASADQLEAARSSVLERRREMKVERGEQSRESVKGKRKFEDRMTLTEAKLTDFEDSRDYVDFLQTKLQGINIKIVK